MKQTILTFILLSTIFLTYGQVETKFYPAKNALEQIKVIRSHPKTNKVKTFPSFNAQKLINEDKSNEGLDIPFRFGKGFDTNITLNDGEWTNVDGGRLWSMEFQSEGAYSINFVLDQFYLPDSAELYISNASGTVLYGPVTSRENTKNGFFLTDLVPGADVTIFLFEPANKKGKSQFNIKRVVHAYKNLIPDSYGNLGGSLSCNNDIACFSAWDEESDAVALVLLSSGTELCSGSLLMTADQSFQPYFLSAFHCIDISSPYGSLSATEISNAENWMFKFQYKMSSCSGSTSTTGITYNGALFRSAWNTSDFALMEMNNSPLGDTRFSWLGWDRSGNTPTSGTGIHHPSGDVMKISFDNNNLTENIYQISWSNGTVSPINTHWVVEFDSGTMEGGSSGSPLFDQNERVVGQLHGGASGCAPVTKYYGQIDRSWTGGGTNTTRLSNWLDPCGSGALTTNTSRTSYISGPSLVCSSGNTFTITFSNNNPPPINSIIWECGPGLTITSGQNTTSCKFSATTSGTSWIRATLVTSCGSFTLPQKTVNTGSLPTPVILGNRTVKCGYETTYKLDNANTTGGETFIWDSDNMVITQGENASQCKVLAGEFNGSATIYCTVTACGVTTTGALMVGVRCESEFSLLISPNPSTSVTTVELVNGSEIAPAEDIEWNLEVYDQSQNLKTRGQKVKVSKQTINTSDWKDGIYIVRAIVGEDIITEKLVVKH